MLPFTTNFSVGVKLNIPTLPLSEIIKTGCWNSTWRDENLGDANLRFDSLPIDKTSSVPILYVVLVSTLPVTLTFLSDNT